MEDRIRNVFAAVFEVQADSVTEMFAPDTVAGWDSLKHVTLALALEDEFGIRFDDDEYGQLESFAAIVSIVRAKVAAQ